MSCKLIPEAHITKLMAYAMSLVGTEHEVHVWYNGAWHRVDYEIVDDIGQVLIDENYRSVNANYETHYEPPQYKYPYTFQPKRVLTPVEAIKACDAYTYQWCDKEYEQTYAHAIAKAIYLMASFRLPGYEEATWIYGEDDADELGAPDSVTEETLT